MGFYSVWTNVGISKRADAELYGTTVVITQVALGNGGGIPVNPDETWTQLVNEVWRGDVNARTKHPENPNWVIVEVKIPMDIGGWTVREVGLYDAEGDMVVVGNYPATYKPLLSEGAAGDVYIRPVLAAENVDVIELTLDPYIVVASREYVDSIIANIETEIIASRRRAFFHANTL